MRRQPLLGMGVGVVLLGIAIAFLGLMLAIRFGLQHMRYEPSFLRYHEPGNMRLFSDIWCLIENRPCEQ